METTNKRDEFSAFVLYLYETDLKEYAYDVLEAPYEPCIDYGIHSIVRACSGRSDAEDLARWTVREAFRRRQEFNPEMGAEGLKEWLREICRKEAKHTIPVKLEESCVVADRREYEWSDRRQREDLVRKAGARFHDREEILTPQQKECFIGEIKGETQVETAQRLGIAPQTVNQHRRVAIEKMRAREKPAKRKSSGRTKRHVNHAEQQRAFFLAGLLLHNIIGVEMEEIVVESIIGVPIDETELVA